MSWEQEVNYGSLRKLYTEAEEELQETNDNLAKIDSICRSVFDGDTRDIAVRAVDAIWQIRNVIDA